MSVQRSANFKRVDGLRWSLRVGLLGLLMAGCQTASLRSAADRPAPSRLVSESFITVPQRQPNGTDDASKFVSGKALAAGLARKIDAISPEASALPLKNRELFVLASWQSEEPPPLLGGDNDTSSEEPFPEMLPEVGCEEICFGCDFRNALPTLWSDTKGIVNWNNALILTAAGGVAIGIRQSNLDQRVREEVVEHPERWGHASQTLGKFGEVKYQAPVMLGVYGYSVWTQNEELHDVMGSMLSATVITGVGTSALKLITNTDRPSDRFSNGHYGFPSYHTSSTFAIAAVLDEYYGCQVGLPAYALAAAVGFSRIDQQAHDLSDVVFGAALGFVIGKTVAAQHRCDDSNVEICPYFHPTDGTPGVAWAVKF